MWRSYVRTCLAIAPPVVLSAGLLSGCGDPQIQTAQQAIRADILSPDVNAHFVEGQTLTLLGQASDPNPSTSDDLESLLVTVNVDSKKVATSAPGPDGRIELELDTLGLQPGSAHTLQLTASRTGNPNATPDAIVFYVDANMAPTAEITGIGSSSNLYAGSPTRVGLKVTDAESRYDEMQVTLALNGEPLNGGAAVKLSAGSSSHEGKADLYVTFQEGDGQVLSLTVTDKYRKSVTIDRLVNVGPPNRSPALCEILAPVSTDVIYEGEALMLKGLAGDPDQSAASLTYTWWDGQTLLAEGHPTSSGDIAATVSNGLIVGPHVITLTVQDELGASCESQRDLEVLPENRAPEVEILYPSGDLADGAVLNEEQTFRFDLQARDWEDVDPVAVKLTAGSSSTPITGSSCLVAGTGVTGQGQNAWDYECTFPASSLVGMDKVTVYARAVDSLGLEVSARVVIQILRCLDADGDGYTSCKEPGCDADPTINPGRPEVCDGQDNNCDGVSDADAVNRLTFYHDGDGDKYGNPAESVLSCSPPVGYVPDGGDCDDAAALVNPSRAEVCGDAKDNDCDGLIDENFDQDSDGYSQCDGDCDDSNASIHPNAPEQCNGLDDNCDKALPEVELDRDNDGFPMCQENCDDDATAYPGALEQCNGKDDDCDGEIPELEVTDSDGDGYADCKEEACKDDASRNPGQSEQCNGVDDDCDGVVDDGLDRDRDGYVPCQVGDRAADCDDRNAAINPGASEQCDGFDGNCDGLADTDPEFDLDDDGVAWCLGDCDDSDPAIFEGAEEELDARDNDCDGEQDDLLAEGSADGSFVGEDYRHLAGSAIAGIGDVNHDGYADFAIGVPRYTDSKAGSGAGRAYIFLGDGQPFGRQMAVSTADGYFTGYMKEDEAGGAVAALGDVNGDGVDDFAVGARYSRGSQPGAPALTGATYVFFGCKASSNAQCMKGLLKPSVTLQGEASQDLSGSAIAPAGDVNCDGRDDFLVSAPEHMEGERAAAGKVYLLFGRSSGWSASMSLSVSDVRFQAENQDDRLGSSLSAAPGDLNGDGCDDVVLGAPSSYSAMGKVYVFFGRSSWAGTVSAADASVVLTGEAAIEVGYSKAGTALTLTDLDADGLDDLVIGAPEAMNSRGFASAGRVYAVLGRPREAWATRMNLSEADIQIEGDLQPEKAGLSLAGGRDFNGDGWEDLVIGAPNWSRPDYTEPTFLGRVYVFYGGPGFELGLLETLDATASFSGGTPGQSNPAIDAMNSDQVGNRVALIGNLYDGDEQVEASEMLISTPYYDYNFDDVGKVYLVVGRELEP